jgi:hypothetical protein
MVKESQFRSGKPQTAGIYGNLCMWVNYNDLTGIMVNKGNHPQMALIQVSEIL